MAEHNYIDPRCSSEPDRISYIGKTGDDAWEKIGPENGWEREEMGKCCFANVSEEGKSIRFCNECGRSVNGLVGWRKKDEERDEDTNFILKSRIF